MTTGAGIGVMRLQAKGHQGLLEPPEAGRGKEPSKAACLTDADRTPRRNELRGGGAGEELGEFCSWGILGTTLNSQVCSWDVSRQRYQHEGWRAGGRSRAEGPKWAGRRGWGRSRWGSPLPQPAPLFETPGHLLDKFIKDFLQPNKIFLDQLHKAVNTICTFLKENCFRHSTIKVHKIVQVSARLSLKGCSWQGAKRFLELGHAHPHQRLEGKG